MKKLWGVVKLLIGAFLVLAEIANVVGVIPHTREGHPGTAYWMGVVSGALVMLGLGIFLIVSGLRTLREPSLPV